MSLAALGVAAAFATQAPQQLNIPAVANGPVRAVTVDDVVRRRIADTLALSPDGRRFAVFVRQRRPETNDFATGWFVGTVAGGPLVPVGDGGTLGPTVMFTGHMPGMVSGGPAHWSPDGQWITYTLRRDGALQLWRSRADGTRQEQLTRVPGDVRDFAWAEDGQSIQFRTERPRAEQAAAIETAMRQGLRYREDLWQVNDLMGPALIRPRPVDPALHTIGFDGGPPRAATAAEQARFERRAAPPPAAPAPDPDHRACAAAGAERVCILATAARPDRIVAIAANGAARELADLNPEYRRLSASRVERIEWPTPRYAWNAPGGPLHDLYGPTTYGYVIYPPDYVPGRRYPLFIDPYVADGFASLGDEHALQAYAASGMIVLRSAFPLPQPAAYQRLGPGALRRMYDPALGYPHLTMLMDSTLVALDMLVRRGLVDPQRVGIGGVSHGTFVPLYIMQNHDRIAAISTSSPNWGFTQYYWTSRPRGPLLGEGFPSPEDEAGREFWRGIDIADHLDTIEAPILFNLAASETYSQVRLIRLLADADMAQDVHIYPAETHLKWQPAHIDAIMRRNLDWFRFWLMDQEDPDPAKAAQYARWRELRMFQCRNPRSVRDYCRGGRVSPAEAAPD